MPVEGFQDRELYRELWQLRFSKMLTIERQSVQDYEELLSEFKGPAADHPIAGYLARLVADEKKHVRLVEELLSILARQNGRN